jgi:hypothetical protein
MKKLLLGILFVGGCTLSVLAQNATPAPAPETQPSTEMQDKEMQPVAASELPAAIRTSLEGQDYSGWTVSNTYKKEKEGQTMYVVELKNGTETKKVKFDAEGNKLKEKSKEKSVQ